MSASPSRDVVHEGPFWTPFGRGTVVVAGESLIEVRLPPFSLPAGASLSSPGGPGAGERGLGARRASPGRRDPLEPVGYWAVQLEAYFTGARRTWTPDEVDLDVLGLTAFRREIYRVLLAVPPAQTVSYGELAVLAGRPGAARAVGTAMAENPIAVVVPCHRVVRGDGSLGRYGDDDRWKPFLLQLEAGR